MSQDTLVTESAIAYIMMQESILLESRLDYLKANTPPLSTDHDTTAIHKDTPSIIQHFADNADPTPNKQRTQYIVGLYRAKKIRQEDAPRIKEALSSFEKYKHKLDPSEKQLTVSAYPTVASIEDKMVPHVGTMATKREAERNLNQPGHELKYDDENISIYHLKDKETSQNLYGGGHQRGGTGTSWCTAARSKDCMFDQYAKDGRLHVLHDKKTGSVYQYHTKSASFMDAKDNEISPEDFKAIAPSFHKAILSNPDLLK